MRPWRVAVSGPSMEPARREGAWLLILPPRPAPRRGEVVLLRDPRDRSRLLLKRITEVTREGCVVEGDHAGHSRDSREFGPVPLDDVVGRAAFRYFPLDRIGRIAIG